VDEDHTHPKGLHCGRNTATWYSVQWQVTTCVGFAAAVAKSDGEVVCCSPTRYGKQMIARYQCELTSYTHNSINTHMHACARTHAHTHTHTHTASDSCIQKLYSQTSVYLRKTISPWSVMMAEHQIANFCTEIVFPSRLSYYRMGNTEGSGPWKTCS